jgi:hypothetical protein
MMVPIATVCICIDGIPLVALAFFTICMTASLGLAILNLHTFLAKNSPIVAADVLVVEGWLPDYAIAAAALEFKNGSYQKLIAIGGAIPRGFYLSEYQNFAALAAATLIAIGVEPKDVIIVTDGSQSLGRTSSSALTLSQWLTTSELKITRLNLYTLGTHARRSWLAFQQILAPAIAVGILAAEPLNYDSHRWWHSSEGVRTVISELLAYLYFRIFKR